MKKAITTYGYRALFVMLLLLAYATAWGQEVNRPWLLRGTVTGNMFDGPSQSDIFQLDDMTPGWSAGLGYKFIPSLTVFGNVGHSYVGPRDGGEVTFSDHFTEWDMSLQYNFNNGYIMPQRSKLKPFLAAGMGQSVFNDRGLLTIPLGGGLRYEIAKGLDIEASSIYRIVDKESVNYLQNSLGLVWNFGKTAGLPEPKATFIDSDGDGVADVEDRCPQVAGPFSTEGCPDTDGDGVADEDDVCPDLAGPKALGGCPDGDGDGVADREDRCPEVSGTLNGCPDTDGDGVVDLDDRCPAVAGAANLNGCPDSDGDGIADLDDLCPQEVGTSANRGCPEVDEATVEVLRLAVEGVTFRSGSDDLTSASYVILNDVADALKAHPSYKLKVSGYTDSTGSADLNLQLSKDRANATKDYLVSQGINASRISAEGYGIANPVATNETAAGRAKNRRVEFEVVYE